MNDRTDLVHQPTSLASQPTQGTSLARYLEVAETLPVLSQALGGLADDIHTKYTEATKETIKVTQPMINSLATYGVDPEVIVAMNRSQAVYVRRKFELEDTHLSALVDLAMILTRQR